VRADGLSIEDTYWDVVLDDIVAADRRAAPVHDAHRGRRRLRVGRGVARRSRTTPTARSKRRGRCSHGSTAQRDDQDPGTLEGIPRSRRRIAAGINVNVTLIFSLDRHDQVIDAYLDGLERLARRRRPVDGASVASFFVSRVDTETDRRLPEGTPLRGQGAVANAKLAYAAVPERFSGRVGRARGEGARLQRPLWASTSTKNPAYPRRSTSTSSSARHREHDGRRVGEALHHGEGDQHAERSRRASTRRARARGAGRCGESTSPTSPTRLEREGVDSVRRLLPRRAQHHREAPRRDHQLSRFTVLR
jgi:hypothetical protein